MVTASGAIDAAVEAVSRHEWNPSAPWSSHAGHNYNASCAVCRGDIPAMIAVAAPVLLGDMRAAYDLKVQELARETERVGILAARLIALGHGPDGYHAKPGHRHSCDDCIALAKALGVTGKQAGGDEP